MNLFTVTLTEAELSIVQRALGRELLEKPARAPRAKAAPKSLLGKPPRLSAGKYREVSFAWQRAVAEAVAHPEDREHRMRKARFEGEAFCTNGR